jgi:hypothetical protein
MKWERQTALTRETRNAYNILVGNPEGKKHLGERNVNRENIVIDYTVLKDYGYEHVDRIQLAKKRVRGVNGKAASC